MGKSLTLSHLTHCTDFTSMSCFCQAKADWQTDGLTVELDRTTVSGVTSHRISVSLSIDTFAAALTERSIVPSYLGKVSRLCGTFVLWPSGSCLLLSFCFNVAACTVTTLFTCQLWALLACCSHRRHWKLKLLQLCWIYVVARHTRAKDTFTSPENWKTRMGLLLALPLINWHRKLIST